VREFCGPRASTDSQAFTRGTVSQIVSDGVILNYGFRPAGRCIPCLPGGSLLGRQGDVRGERPWSRQLPGCMYFHFHVRVKMHNFVVTNSLVCFGCQSYESGYVLY